jgi:undecaprenyl phosphate-alpha-L-ara4N flippase subunit ArnE
MTLAFLLLIATVACDIIGQVCFKLGVGHDDGVAGAGEAPVRSGVAAFLGDLVGSPWIVAGVLVYAVEFVVWFAALTRLPLSEAFPFNALAYCGVVLASRYLLHEEVSMRRWLGTLLVAFGVALIFLA